VLIRPCDEGPRVVLNYLTCYVRSGPLHEAQILKADDHEVVFRYLDHRSGKVEVLPCTPAPGCCRWRAAGALGPPPPGSWNRW
jgi:hypothetical protein